MPFIELEVPYFYEASYIPKGKRNPIKETFGGTMTVQVESVSSPEAPLVVSWVENTSWRTSSGDIRTYGNGYYTKPGDNALVTVETVEPSHIFHGYDRGSIEKYRGGLLLAAPEGRVQSIESHWNLEAGMAAVETRKEEIRQSAAQLLFIDGVLHERCELPKIKAAIEYRFHGNDVITISMGEADERTGAHGIQFSVTDLESALAWAEERKSIEGRAEIRNLVEVQVHSPDLVVREPILEGEAIRICRFLFDQNFDFKELSDEEIDEWKACRRALKNATADPSEGNISELLDSWERFYEVHAAEEDARRRSYGSNFNKENDMHYLALTGVRSAWAARPITDDELDMVPRP